jgi:hypothetical protein
MLLQPILNHTGAVLIDPRTIDRPGAVVRASNDSELLKWLIPPLLVPLLCAAICLLVRYSLRRGLTARGNALRTNDSRMNPEVKFAFTRPHAAFDSAGTNRGGQLVVLAGPKKRQFALLRAA